MSLVIRNAKTQDAAAIAHLIEIVFAELVVPEGIKAILTEDDHDTHVAIVEDQLCGFVDGFVTLSSTGQRRWELDLLAVAHNARSKGVGTALIQQSIEAGRAGGAQLIRALVATENLAMHAAMRRAGFVQQSETLGLFVSDDTNELSASTPLEAYIIPVHTLTYRGLWIEGPFSKDDVNRAKAVRAQHEMDLVGVVLPLADAQVALLRAEGFEHISDYHWWKRSLQ